MDQPINIEMYIHQHEIMWLDNMIDESDSSSKVLARSSETYFHRSISKSREDAIASISWLKILLRS